VTAARLLEQLLAPHAPFRLAELQLVDFTHDPGQRLLRLSDLAVDRLGLAHAISMRLGDDRQLGFPSISLHAGVPRLGIGTSALPVQILAPLAHLCAPPCRFIALRCEVPSELAESVDVAAQRVYSL